MIMVRVIGLENSLRVQTGANTRKYMQVNANKVIPICIYFVPNLCQLHHIQGSVFDVWIYFNS